MKGISKQIAKIMLEGIRNEKKIGLVRACERNEILTSYYGLEEAVLTIYREGFYLEPIGCRSSLLFGAGDDDGELVEGRKPAERKLMKLYRDTGKTEEFIDLYDLTIDAISLRIG